MADIPIHNETDYALTEAMTQDILRDAQEHFGEAIHAIRVQSGLARHALNARTREVRYAFSPQDFGVLPPLPPAPEHPRSRRQPLRSDEETAATILPASSEEVEIEEEDLKPLETSLESLSTKGTRTTRTRTSSAWTPRSRRWTRTRRQISWIRRMRRINGGACLLSQRGEW